MLELLLHDFRHVSRSSFLLPLGILLDLLGKLFGKVEMQLSHI